MTLTERNRATGQHEQKERLRLVSPGDLTYAFAALSLMAMQLLPASRRVQVVNKTSTLFGRLLHTLNVHSAKTIRHHLNRILGSHRSPTRIEADLRRLLSLTVWNALMINSLPVFPKEQLAGLVAVDGLDCLDDNLNSGHPILVWSFHFGVHPLVVAAILHARGYPIHAVTHVRRMPAGASRFRRFYLQRLSRIGDQFPVIDPREGLKRNMLDVLRNGQCLYVTPDYMLPPDEIQSESAFVVPIEFLGQRAWLQTGGLRLPKRLEAKVVTVLSTQGNGGERRLIVEPFELPTSGLAPDELQCDLQMCMRRLEAHVLAYPHLWWDLKRDDLLDRLTSIPPDDSDGSL
jgi:lauroyl/myristoyl acyltransferase